MASVDRRALSIGVAVWLLVVVVVSVATWTVIDAAGRDVTARPASDPGAATGATSATEASPRPPGTVTPRPTRKPRPTRTPTTSPRSAAPTTSVSPEATATTPTTPEQGPTSQPSPTRRPSPTREPAPTPQERTWAGRAGTVSVRCVGARISLLSATPANGWRYEVDERGPQRVKVQFQSAGSDRSESESEGSGDEQEIEVRAECAGGVPRFRTDG